MSCIYPLDTLEYLRPANILQHHGRHDLDRIVSSSWASFAAPASISNSSPTALLSPYACTACSPQFVSSRRRNRCDSLVLSSFPQEPIHAQTYSITTSPGCIHDHGEGVAETPFHYATRTEISPSACSAESPSRMGYILLGSNRFRPGFGGMGASLVSSSLDLLKLKSVPDM